MTADRDFLFWLRDRLVHKYGENENTDFVQKLGAIAFKTPPKVDTPAWIAQKRFHVLGETSTVGPRWQIWDEESKLSVFKGISCENTAHETCGLLNKLWQSIERLKKGQPEERWNMSRPDNWNFPKDPKTGKQRRGFAAMSSETQRRIASMGGKASHGGGAKYHKKRQSKEV